MLIYIFLIPHSTIQCVPEKRNQSSWQKFYIMINNIYHVLYMYRKVSPSTFIWCITYYSYFTHYWIRTIESGWTNISFVEGNFKFECVCRVVNKIISEKETYHIKIHGILFYMTHHAWKMNKLCQRTSEIKRCLIYP